MSDTDIAVIDDIVSRSRKELAPTMAEDDFWEFFTAKELLRDTQLDPDEIQSGMVGHRKGDDQTEGSDGGLDAVYLLVNGVLLRDVEQASEISHRKGIVFEIVIIQSKTTAGFSLDAINRLANTCESIFKVDLQPEDFSEKYNARLLDTILRFRAAHTTLLTRKPEINVTLFYATRGDTKTINDTLAGKAKELEEKVKTTLATVRSCKFEFVGARDLIGRWRAPQKFEIKLRCFQSISDGSGGHVALVELGEFYRLIATGDRLREFLFESNVRDYEGAVDVNRQIQETLTRSDGPPFWWLNNGITILANEIGGGTPEFSLHEPQIVNGLQTSQEIFTFFRESGKDPSTEKRHTVVRMIKAVDDETQDRIIRATNSQTRIPQQYLRASDEFQRDLEITFRERGMHYDRRKNSWRKAGVPLAKVVGLSELAQNVAAIILGEADHARARPSRYFKDTKEYRRVFNAQRPPLDYVVCAQLRKRVDAFLKTEVESLDKRNDLVFYLLMAVGHPVYMRDRRKFRNFDVSTVSMEALKVALNTVSGIYESNGWNAKAAKGTGMVCDLLKELGLPPRREPAKRKTKLQKTLELLDSL